MGTMNASGVSLVQRPAHPLPTHQQPKNANQPKPSPTYTLPPQSFPTQVSQPRPKPSNHGSIPKPVPPAKAKNQPVGSAMMTNDPVKNMEIAKTLFDQMQKCQAEEAKRRAELAKHRDELAKHQAEQAKHQAEQAKHQANLTQLGAREVELKTIKIALLKEEEQILKSINREKAMALNSQPKATAQNLNVSKTKENLCSTVNSAISALEKENEHPKYPEAKAKLIKEANAYKRALDACKDADSIFEVKARLEKFLNKAIAYYPTIEDVVFPPKK